METVAELKQEIERLKAELEDLNERARRKRCKNDGCQRMVAFKGISPFGKRVYRAICDPCRNKKNK